MSIAVTLRTTDTQMLREAGAAAAAVDQQLASHGPAIKSLAQRLHADPPPAVITCARGSSDHAATYGKYLIETLVGIPVCSAALSVASVYERPVRAPGALFLAISQSGRSPDLLATAEAYQRGGARVVALVNDETSPLASLADVTLCLEAGPEHAVAATKSYIASLFALASIAATWSKDASLRCALRLLPDQLRQAFEADWSQAEPTFAAARNLFVIGRGYGLGIAQEAALKLKETSGLHAEAFSSAEVRHGPMTIVGQNFPILAFATSDPAGDSVREIVKEFGRRGACVHLADPRLGDRSALPTIATHPALEPLLMIQSFYRFANALSLKRDHNPDAPPHLAKVTRTL